MKQLSYTRPSVSCLGIKPGTQGLAVQLLELVVVFILLVIMNQVLIIPNLFEFITICQEIDWWAVGVIAFVSRKKK